jgi:hypothetical protein
LGAQQFDYIRKLVMGWTKTWNIIAIPNHSDERECSNTSYKLFHIFGILSSVS